MIKVATFNISGGFYIGNEDTEYLDREAVDSVDNRLKEQIINIINEEQFDAICFQEIITTEEVAYLKSIAENTNLKYYDFFELSECNIVKNTRCGIAIFSKYPMNSIVKEMFPNPRLSKTTASGNTYYTYDKGYMICSIEKDGKAISILTHHGFPYGRFNSTSSENKPVFSFFDDVVEKYNPDIVTGDFNADNFMELMPKMQNTYIKTTNDVTTVDGKKLDNILVHKNIGYSSKTMKLLSDHFIVISNLEGEDYE